MARPTSPPTNRRLRTSSFATTMARRPRRRQRMRRSIFLRTLWSFRVAILGWGVGVGILMFIVVAAFDTAIGGMPPSTQEEFLLAFQSVGFLGDYPKAVVSSGGYATAKYSIFLILVSIWGILA